jgi:hypothetical protein
MFKSVIGYSSNTLLKTVTIANEIVAGRSKKVVGLGPYSNLILVLAATCPYIAERPYFLAFKDGY